MIFKLYGIAECELYYHILVKHLASFLYPAREAAADWWVEGEADGQTVVGSSLLCVSDYKAKKRTVQMTLGKALPLGGSMSTIQTHSIV